MSTKTTFKRIALVAVAALGLGVLSVAPSSAVVSGLTVTVTNGTSGLTAGGGASDSTTAALINIAGYVETLDSVTVSVVEKSKPLGGSSAVRIHNVDSATPTISSNYKVETVTADTGATARGAGVTMAPLEITPATTTVVRLAMSSGAANINQNLGLQLDSATSGRIAGTYTYTVVVKIYDAGASVSPTSNPTSTIIKDVSIVIAAAADASKTPSAAFSNVFIGDAATSAPTSDAAGVNAVATASASAAAHLGVQVKNALNGSTAVDTITLTVSGPGSLIVSSVPVKSAVVIGQVGTVNYQLRPDGVAGVSTITAKFELTGQTFTKTVTFYAKNATTITPSVRTPALKVGANTEAVGVTAVDVNGNAWTGDAYIVASSAADALIAGSTTPVKCNAFTAVKGIRCDVTGVTAGTAKFKVMDAATVGEAKAISAEFSLTVSTAPAATVKVEFDKTTYAPYEKAVITVSPLDASGALVPAATFANLFAAGGISANQSFTGTSDTLTPVSITTSSASSSTTGAVALKAVYTVYMPAQGDVTLSWTGGTSLPAAGQVRGSTTVSVVNSSADAATDAANEATDAANAATDAALAAADAADAATAAAQDASDAVAALSASVSKLISSLRAQITSLTNLVIKIQKKVRA
jgi:trimeric autotransporter adhesin